MDTSLLVASKLSLSSRSRMASQSVTVWSFTVAMRFPLKPYLALESSLIITFLEFLIYTLLMNSLLSKLS